MIAEPIIQEAERTFVPDQRLGRTARAGSAMPDADPAAKTMRVLIAEDNPDLQLVFSRVFEGFGYAVKSAMDGVEAIERLKAELPDVLILDVNMPRLSGFEVLAYLRSEPTMKHLKVILVTGNCVAGEHPDAQNADLVLIKPVNIMHLVSLAQRLYSAA